MRKRLIPFACELLEDRLNPGTIPVLNSFPTAPADIYLDFDGDTARNVTPYDTDGNPTDFSTSEQNDILRCWDQISTYFAPFNVNVTTVFSSARPKVWHASGNNISGGYSYVNVFPNSQVESFNQSSDARTRFSGIAHEAGHNFGLSHQSAFNSLGVETADYISAVEPLRGFLMGVDYSGTVKKFSIGHTSNASGLQDDVAVITGDLDNYGGDGYRPDDVPGTIAGAVAMTVNGAVQSGQGIIERLNDFDYWSFTTTEGRYAITVAPTVPSGLDAVLEIRDASNAVIAVADTPGNGQTITVTLPTGTYYAVVSSKGNYSDIGKYDVFVKEGAPEGWQTQNIGPQWNTGSTGYNSASGVWTVSGSGADIWNTSDMFQYAWQYLSGNGTITARVTNIENTNGNAKAGVMIRESLDSGSRHASSFAQRSFAPQMVWRSNTNGTSSSAGGASATFTPRWVRLTKSGNSIVSAYSSDGTNWTTISTQTVSVGTNFYIGLAVTSHEDEETNTTDDINDATFTNVTITGFTNPTTVTNSTLPAPANLVATLGTGNGVNLVWDAVTGASNYQVERSQDQISFVPISTTANLNYSDVNPLGSQRYWYRVRAIDAAGRSEASTVASIINRPSPIRLLDFTSYTNTQIVLDWLDTDGESGFKIERSPDNTTWTTIGTVGKNVPSYTASGLTTGTQYYFRVSPTSSLGDGNVINTSGMTRLPIVTGTALATITSTSVQINWTNLSSATGYRIERSTDGTTFASIGTVGAGVTTFVNTGLTPETEYYYRIIGTATGTESAAGTTVVMCGTLPTLPIASPWIAADIGISATTQKGMSSRNAAGTFKVISAGADIWGTSDNFRFTYQQLVGNGVITAKVDAAENTGGWAKIGVMVRETLNANSRHSHVFVTPSNGVNMQSRSSTGGSSSTTGSITALVAPYWVRMKRVGNVLTSYASPDGNTWTQVGTITLSNLAQTVYIGLSANANTSSLLNTSTYSNVSVQTVGVQGVTVDDATTQRSRVRSLTVTFNGLVTLPANPANAFTVTQAGGSTQPFTVSLSGSTPTQTIARLTFNTELADGNYTLTVLANQITDASGMGLGNPAANSSSSFHRLFGDSNGDRTIDAADFGAFGNAFGVTSSTTAFDFNNDASVDASDFAQFGNRFGMTI